MGATGSIVNKKKKTGGERNGCQDTQMWTMTQCGKQSMSHYQSQSAQDPGGTGQFYKMTDRPLMSLIDNGEGGHRGGAGLPPGMRTDGIYFLPNLPAQRGGAEGGGEEGGGEGERTVPLLQTVAGRSDRVYFLVGTGIVRTGGGEG